MLKRLASHLPPTIQNEARRWKIWLDMKRDRFTPSEPEFELLTRWVHPGDWALDIGANVGYYSMRLAKLVGPDGRVIALEPIHATSELLTFFARTSGHDNITIMNLAASDGSRLLKFSIDRNEHGLPDYFTARVTDGGTISVLAITIDSLALPHRIAFVKIDTEGEEHAVVRGMRDLIQRDHPVLLIEGDESLLPVLSPYGYRMPPRRHRSPNLLFLPSGAPDP